MVINDANLTFGEMAKRTKTTLLVLHHAAGNGPVEQIHGYHKNTKGWAGIGYHFYIRKDGSVWRGRPEDTVGAHTLNYNSVSIGVCFEGNFENEQMSDAQKNAGRELVAYLKEKYPSVAEVKRHGDLRATDCPGKNFPFDEIANGASESETETKESKVKQFQLAAIADGFKFPKYGADGVWGSECESVAKIAVCKQRVTYKYKNLTKIVQEAVGVSADGLFGTKTKAAVKAYQKANGLTADGAVGINTWKKILNV